MTDETPKKPRAKKSETGEEKAAAPKKKSAAASSEEKPKKAAAPKASGEAKPKASTAKKATASKAEAPAAEAPVAAETSESPKAEAPKKAAAPKTESKTEKTSAAKSAKAPRAAKKKVAEKSDRLQLSDLKPAEGSKRLKTRVGRGRATGHGKTSRRGHNGEGQRAGRSVKRGFEGGQMPLYRKIPKINGFKLINSKKWLELTTRKAEILFQRAGKPLTAQQLQEMRLFNPERMYGIRLIGNTAVSKAIEIEVHYVSPAAKQAIEKAGGKITMLPTSVSGAA